MIYIPYFMREESDDDIQQGRAIPFIVVEDEKFIVTPEAERFLSTIQGPLGIVAVTGKFRTGKSFLLNQLIPHGGKFEVGPTVEACTKGIWMWSEPIYKQLEDGTELAIIFLDSEGIGAATATAEHDARIFSLATLLSSLIIYNSVGVIDEDAISNLSFVANLSRLVQQRSSSDSKQKQSNSSTHSDDEDDYHRKLHSGHQDGSLETLAATSEGAGDFFPTFLWVLRDFMLELVDSETGEQFTPKEFLEMCLQQSEGFSSDIQARNKIRRTLTSFFKERDCATLVRPVDDEERLAIVDTLPKTELRKEFRRQMKDLRHHIYDDLVHPKTFAGSLVRGPMLAGLARAYVEAINNNSVPNLQDAWLGVTNQECEVALKQAISKLSSLLSEKLSSSHLPVDIDVLDSTLESIKRDVLALFDQVAVGPQVLKYRYELKQKLESQFSAVKLENLEQSESSCNRLASILWTKHIGSMKAEEFTEASIEIAISNLKKAYFQSARGPSAHSSLLSHTLTSVSDILRLTDSSRRIAVAAAEAEGRQKLSEVSAELDMLRAREAVYVAELADTRRVAESAKQSEMKLSAEAVLLSQSTNELERRLSALEKERDALVAEHELQISALKAEAEVLKKRTPVAVTQVDSTSSSNLPPVSTAMDTAALSNLAAVLKQPVSSDSVAISLSPHEKELIKKKKSTDTFSPVAIRPREQALRAPRSVPEAAPPSKGFFSCF